MIHFSTTRLVTSDINSVLDVITHVGAYPDFLPWLKAVHVDSFKNGDFQADFMIDYGPFQAAYASEVTVETLPSGEITVTSTAVKGHVNKLHSCWKLIPIRRSVTRIIYNVDVSVENRALHHALGVLIKPMAEQILSAFLSRIESVQPTTEFNSSSFD